MACLGPAKSLALHRKKKVSFSWLLKRAKSIVFGDLDDDLGGYFATFRWLVHVASTEVESKLVLELLELVEPAELVELGPGTLLVGGGLSR